MRVVEPGKWQRPEEMQEWSSRPLDEVYVVIFIDALVEKVRDGQVANRPIYTAVNAEAARTALGALTEKWGSEYGALVRLWNNAWEEFIPFLDYELEIRG